MPNGEVQSTCIICVIKHYSLAVGFYEETITGYPHHILYLVSQLGLAEWESKEKYPEISCTLKNLRREVLAVIDTGRWDDLLAVGPKLMPTFIWMMQVAGETFIIDHLESNANKVDDLIMAWHKERSRNADISMG